MRATWLLKSAQYYILLRCIQPAATLLYFNEFIRQYKRTGIPYDNNMTDTGQIANTGCNYHLRVANAVK